MPDFSDPDARPRFTGRSLVAVKRSHPAEAITDIFAALISTFAPLFEHDNDTPLVERSVVFPELGAAIVPGSAERLRLLTEAHADFDVVVVGRERYLYPPRQISGIAPDAGFSALDALGVRDEHDSDVGILILDAGFDVSHPDFLTRAVNAMPFVADGKGPEDLTGHGTHCGGLACGPQKPAKGRRYGVAASADLATGRIMRDSTASARDEAVLAGLRWAMLNGIAVVNMSFGCEVLFDEVYDPAFEEIAARVLDADVLLVAAAGNDPQNTQHPVEHPANCPSVMAVAALDRDLEPSAFSCVGVNPGQYIDVAAPGIGIRSSYRGDYAELSGTSMAAALVSGVAALWASTPAAPRGRALWKAVVTSNPTPTLASRLHVGAGLVKAPAI